MRPNRTYLAGFGISAALLAAVGVAFVGVGTFVAFHGWPAGDSANQAGESVYVGAGEPASVPSRAAAKALDEAPSSVAAGPLPSPALIAAAGGTPLPSPGSSGNGGTRSGGRNNGGGRTDDLPPPPPPPPPTIVGQVRDGVNQTPVGQTGMLDPVFDALDGDNSTGQPGLLDGVTGLVGGLLGTVGGVVGGLAGGTSQ